MERHYEAAEYKPDKLDEKCSLIYRAICELSEEDQLAVLQQCIEYVEMSITEKSMTKCPVCSLMSVKAKMSGGEKCTSPGCGYWFCY